MNSLVQFILIGTLLTTTTLTAQAQSILNNVSQAPTCQNIYNTDTTSIIEDDLLTQTFKKYGTLTPDYLGRQPIVENYDNLTTPEKIRKFVSDWKKQTSQGRVIGQFDKELDTWLYHTYAAELNTKGEVPLVASDAEAVVIFFHGSGTAKSSGINAQQLFNSLVEYKVAGVSFDYPFHGKGPHSEKFNDKKYFIDWLNKIVQKVKAYGKPIYLVGHSYGPDAIAEYLTYYPFEVQGAMFMSPAGFDPILSNWYKQKTSKMNFGGDVQENPLGSTWAGLMSAQYVWNRSQGQYDPSIRNPDLNLQLLYGNWEEYAPAPTGGKNKTPIGKNTYSIGDAFKKHIRNVNLIELDGIGHYLFDHQDSKGRNSVQYNIITKLLNLAWKDKKENKSWTETEFVRIEYIRNSFFNYFANKTYGPKAGEFFAKLENEKIAKKIIADYILFFEVEIEKPMLQVLSIEKEKNTDLYIDNKEKIDLMLKKGRINEDMYLPVMNRLAD